MRKILGILVAAGALLGGALASRAVDASRDQVVRRETARTVEAASQRVAESLSATLADLKLKADNASSNPRLVFALQGNADERTMRDLWRTEEWWRPWRTEFKVYAVASTGLGLDVVEGVEAADLDCEALIRRVRERGEAAADVLVAKGWPYAAAATSVRVPGRETSPVLLLAKPIDAVVMRRLAEKSGGAVSLTNGRTALIDAGPEPERALLTGAFGSEGAGPIFHAKDGTWAAAVTPVASGLWLWTFVSAAAAAHDASAPASERKLMLWGAAAVLALFAMVWGFRRRAPAFAPTLTNPTLTTSASTATPSGRTRAGLGDLSASGPPDGSAESGSPVSGTSRGGVAASGIDGHAATTIASNPTVVGPGATFGRYTLLDRLGEGGMAEVYTAVTFGAEGFRRKFVVKRLRAELAREPAVVDQFIDEANLASSMVHSNIVPVFDFGKVGDEYFMAQEYILGRDLTRVTNRSLEKDGRPLGAPVVLYAAHETLKALEYAHAKTNEQGQPLGIVHRDVSPSNVIVSARGEVKLFDFGIVKAEGRVTKTESGVVKGNVTFMSPEQARGLAVDARADLFSLGLVLYYCMTGQVLYAGQTTYELLVKAATGPGADEYNLVAALPHPLPALLHRALQVKPEDRFQSAREFSDAIVAHIGAGAAQLATLMHHLFMADFKDEEARFSTVTPVAPSGAPGSSGGSSPTGPGVQQTNPRRS